MRDSRLFVGSLASSIVLCAAGIARAEGSTAVSLDYQATSAASCPSAESFRESVETRMPAGRTVVNGGPRSIHARVELYAARDGAEARARVTVTTADRVVEREVDGRSCAEVAQASALLVALFAEPDASAEDSRRDVKAAEPPALAVVRSTVAKKDADSAARDDGASKHVAILLNPLGVLTIGRYSAQVEILPGKHHAFTFNPFFVNRSRKHIDETQAYDLGDQNGVGGELGYRYYLGTKGPNGFFVGPSAIVATFWATGGERNVPRGFLFDTKPTTYSAFGGAFDFGGQVVLGPGIVLGGGAGMQYLVTTGPTDEVALIEGRGSLSPRLLATVGYAF